MPRRLTVTAGTPTAALPVSHTRIASARSRSAFFGTKSSSPPVPCSSDPSTTSLRLTGTSSPERPQGGQVHQDVALAVGGPAPEPAARRPRSARTAACARRRRPAAAARRSARRAAPSGRPGRGTGRRPDHRVAAVGGLVQADVGEAVARGTRRAPTAAARAHSSGGNWRGSATDLIDDEVGELARGRAASGSVIRSARSMSSARPYHVVGLEVVDVLLKSSSSSGQ